MKRRWAFLLVAVALCAAGPLLTMAQTTYLQVSKSGNDVVLAFSSTSGPWHVVRSISPRFDYNNILLASATSTSPIFDANAATQPDLWFYDASDTGAGETPADNGQPSDEPIILTSLSPNYGWEGQTVTVNGTGFGDIPTDNLVFFGPLLATVTGGTSTYLTVTVPVGVTACSVIVQRGGLASNALAFTAVMESAYSGNAFQNILSIVFNDRTADATSKGHLFFGDTGTGLTSDYLYEVMNDYSLSQRTYFNEMKGLPMDSAGNIYLANTTYASNAGLVKKYDPVTHILSTYTNGKQVSETNSVSIVGLALRSDGIVFLANRYDNTLRRRDPAGAGATIFATGYTWDVYMGMAMDSANTLYFTNGGTLYKTPTGGAASITTVATGFSAASGIAIDESTGNTLILLADRGAGNIYLINAQAGSMDLVGSGFNAPRAVAFGKDNVTGDLYYYVAEATRIIRLPDPRISLDSRISRGAIKVLISKKGTTDTYPCSLQTQDAKITIALDVQGKISTPTTLYAKLYDPKDPSSYVTGTDNDNRDPAKNGGAGAGTFQSLLSATSFTVDATHRHFELTLTLTNQYAGDNYQVGFSFDPAFLGSSTIKPAAKTGIFTAWKREYIEKDKMFRRGAILVANCTACSSLLVADGQNLQNGDTIIVFDEINTAESGGETRTVSGAPTNNSNGSWTVNLSSAVSKTYYASGPGAQGSPPTYGPPDFANGHSGGVGVPSAGYYEADRGAMSQTYNDAFVEFSAPPDGVGAVPYLPESWFRIPGDTDKRLFHQVWFLNKLPMADPQYNYSHNHFHLIGTGLYRDTGDVVQNGFTFSQSDISFVCAGSIEVQCAVRNPQCSGQQIANHVQETTDHEIAHQFNVDGCDPKNHDLNNAWCGGTGGTCDNTAYGIEYCIMHEFDATYSLEMRIDGIARMDCDDLAAAGSGCGVPACAGGVSVRTDTDPE